MSALDQAFIKAYSQQNPALAAASAAAKKSCEQKESGKAAIAVESSPSTGLATGAGKVLHSGSAAEPMKGPSKRKAKSPSKAASDSVFESIERASTKETATAKATKSKKTTSAKGVKKSTSSTAGRSTHAAQEKTTKKLKASDAKVSSPVPAKSRSITDVTYRLDLSPSTNGGLDSANVRPAVPAPHTDVIFSARDSVLPQRTPLTAQAVLPTAEAAPELKPNSAKAAKAETSGEKQLPPAFSEGWANDFTRSLSNLEPSAPAANPPEPVPDLDTAKTPAEIFESLSASMKQYQAAKQIPLPEKKVVREEPIPQNTNNPSVKTMSSEKPAAPETPSVPAIRLFQPMLQVDHFAWPKVCGRLESSANAELERVIETLLAAQLRGKKSFMLGGCRSGDGATSLLMAAARRLAAQQMKVVLVEADWSQPQLARRLGLLPQYGWEDVLLGRLPLEEVLIESIAEKLVILPVREPFSTAELPAEAAGRMVETWNSLRHHFDMLLVDPGPLASSPILDRQYAGAMAGRIDAAIMVKNLRQQDHSEFDAASHALHNAGAKILGIVENFAG